LQDLCGQHSVNPDNVLKLLDAVRKYELEDCRTGVYDLLRDILMARVSKDAQRPA
jgi:hypothetical protein